MATLEYIKQLEIELIKGNKSVSFYEMMNATYKLIGERQGILRKEHKDEYHEIVTSIVKSIYDGMTIGEACRFNKQSHSYLISKLSDKQYKRIKVARYDYMINFKPTVRTDYDKQQIINNFNKNK